MKKKCLKNPTLQTNLVKVGSIITKLSRDTDISIQEEQSKLYSKTFIKVGELARQHFIKNKERITQEIVNGTIPVYGDYPLHGDGEIEVKFYVRAPVVQEKIEKEFVKFTRKLRAMVNRKKKEEKQKIKELLKDTRAE